MIISWGGTPGPRPTPPSACRAMRTAAQTKESFVGQPILAAAAFQAALPRAPLAEISCHIYDRVEPMRSQPTLRN